MRRFFVATIVLLCGSTSWAFGHGDSGLEQALASVGPNGKVALTLWKAVPETATRRVTVIEQRVVKYKELVNGKEVYKEKTESVPVAKEEAYAVWKSVPVTTEADPQHTRYYETDGRKVDPKTLSRRLSKPTLVVLQNDGKPLPSHFAWMFKPGTLVVSMEPLPMVSPVAPEPIAAPAKPLPEGADGSPPPEQPKPEDTGPSASRGGQFAVFPVSQATAAPEGPGGPAPQFQFIGLKSGKLNIRQTNEHSFEQTAVKEISDASGTKTQVPFSMTIVNRTSTVVQIDPQHVQIVKADRKPVDARELPQLLPNEQAGIVSLDGKPVDRFWLQNIKPAVLVVMLPGGAPRGYGAYGYGMPGPVPLATPQVTPPSPERKPDKDDEKT